jgi:copper homeostasis protein
MISPAPQLEICIEDLESARAAHAGGAQRLEVCGALSSSGITPSAGLVERCVELGSIAVMMMIRPHGGSFCYDTDDQQTMLRDIQLAHRLQVQGIVFGALTADHQIDVELSRRLIAAARPLSVTFHRAFDLVPEPLRAIDLLLELGVDRLLTSGQAPTALAGSSLLRQLVRHVSGQLTIVAGGGVRDEHVAQLIAATGVWELHGSASRLRQMTTHDPLGLIHPVRSTQVDTVQNMVTTLRRAVSDYRSSGGDR